MASKSEQLAIPLWRGTSTDGRGRVVLFALPSGGNRATGPCLDLYVAAESFVRAQRLMPWRTHSNTAAVVDLIKPRATTAAGCPVACEHLQGESCYALHGHNVAGQTRAALRSLLHCGGGEIPDVGDPDAAIRLAAAVALSSGRVAVRACVSGDLSQVPESVGSAVLDGLRAAGLSRRYVYTHGWAHKRNAWIREYGVASVSSATAEAAARRRGWNVFRVTTNAEGKGRIAAGAAGRCHKDATPGGTCAGCPTPCDGEHSVWIPEHGPRRMKATAAQRRAAKASA